LMREALAELYGLKGSFIEQYLAFWGRVLRGDFGPSLSAFPTPVTSLIMQALPWTLGLLLQALIISWCLGNLLGALAGYFRSNLLLKLSGALVMALHPVPAYIIGLVLLLLFGFIWPILP